MKTLFLDILAAIVWALGKVWYDGIGAVVRPLVQSDWFWIGCFMAAGFGLFVGIGTLLKFLLWWDWGLYLTPRAVFIWGGIGVFIGWFIAMVGIYGGR
jgi:hypothetical protein